MKAEWWEGNRWRQSLHSAPAPSPAQPPSAPKSHWPPLESGLLHIKGWLQSAETIPTDGGSQWASTAAAERSGWTGELGWGRGLPDSPGKGKKQESRGQITSPVSYMDSGTETGHTWSQATICSLACLKSLLCARLRHGAEQDQARNGPALLGLTV